ncbi:unnamed protein product [Haemonchus placei]|uniref:Uncharacterized protein n=1 Tax=Haemonchus placei TaxID=6290 RepID=A0A0N4W1B0_HAEPC|nr:unnamed protein product [Haemonchus placei]
MDCDGKRLREIPMVHDPTGSRIRGGGERPLYGSPGNRSVYTPYGLPRISADDERYPRTGRVQAASDQLKEKRQEENAAEATSRRI